MLPSAVCGPITMNRLGKPSTITPRKVEGPLFHRSLSFSLPRPRMSMRSKLPVMASKPVAYTMMSNSNSRSLVWRPVRVMRSIGVSRS